MAQPILEMAKDLVMALIEKGLLSPEEVQKELQNTHTSLRSLQSKEEGDGGHAASTVRSTRGTVDWKSSIKKHAVECLVCGATFKQLSARHLRTHDLDPRTYRQQFGIPRSQPLSAKETTARRKQIVQINRPWEKAPTYIKSHGQHETSRKAVKPKQTRKKRPAQRA